MALEVEFERYLNFLASRSISLMDSDERIGSRNNGNYLGLLELVEELVDKFDSQFAQHLEKYDVIGSGKTSYLSKKMCEEIVNLMDEEIHSIIICEVKQAKYYLFSAHSTPGILQAGSCLGSISDFRFLKALYNFSASTY